MVRRLRDLLHRQLGFGLARRWYASLQRRSSLQRCDNILVSYPVLVALLDRQSHRLPLLQRYLVFFELHILRYLLLLLRALQALRGRPLQVRARRL